MGGGIGSLTYVPAGSVVSWQAIAESRLLIFHFPGRFDRALTGGRGQGILVVAWLESMGTGFLTNIRLTPCCVGCARLTLMDRWIGRNEDGALHTIDDVLLDEAWNRADAEL
jgi:hypothetical protein